MKKSVLVLAMILGLGAPAQAAELQCRDGSFAYRELRVNEQGNSYKIAFFGEAGDFAFNAGLIPNRDWTDVRVEVEIPKAFCEVSSTDRRLITCNSSAFDLSGGFSVKVHLSNGLVDTEKLIQATMIQFDSTHVAREFASGDAQDLIESRFSVWSKSVPDGMATDSREFPNGNCVLKN